MVTDNSSQVAPARAQCTLKPVLSGNADFWQLVLCTLPALVLFYIATVLTLTSGDAGVLMYVRNGALALTGRLHASHPLALAFRPLLISMVLGMLLGVIDSAFSTGDCIDFLTRMTTATVQAESTWQWLWVVLHCCSAVTIVVFITYLQPCGVSTSTRGPRSLWLTFTCSGHRAASKRAFQRWRARTQNSCVISMRSFLLSWFLHLPVLCIAAVPAVGYVSCSQVAFAVLIAVVSGAGCECAFWEWLVSYSFGKSVTCCCSQIINIAVLVSGSYCCACSYQVQHSNQSRIDL